MLRSLVLLCLALILAACQSPAAPAPTAPPQPTLPPPPTHTPAPTATLAPTATPGPTLPPTPTPGPFPESFFSKETVNGNLMVINCQGTGEPTIILENGYGLYSWPDPGNYPKISRTCSYTRAGMLGPVTGPRTTLDQVKDLHQLLAQVGVPGPYILVGHASAGFNLPLYTETYPQEVVGLVCADCFLPTFEAIIVEKLKVKFANAPDQLQKNLAKVLVYSGYEPSSQEKIDFTASQQQVLKVKSLGSRPVVALVAGLTVLRINVGEIEKECDEAWREAGLKFSQMSTQGRTEVLENDDFNTILKSSTVFKAIQEVFDKVKKP